MSLCGSVGKEALNDDVLVLCFGHLEIADVLSANLVSSDWRRASEHDSIWEPLCEKLCATKTAQYHLTPARKATLGYADWSPELDAKEETPGLVAIAGAVAAVWVFVVVMEKRRALYQ